MTREHQMGLWCGIVFAPGGVKTIPRLVSPDGTQIEVGRGPGFERFFLDINVGNVPAFLALTVTVNWPRDQRRIQELGPAVMA